MKKRVLSLVLALTMVLALVPSAAFAADITVTGIVPPKYSWMGDTYLGPENDLRIFRNDLEPVLLNGGNWGYIDTTGKEVAPCKYDDARDFSEGLAAVKLDGKWGFIDATGKEVVPCTLEYSSISLGFGGFAKVYKDDMIGVLALTSGSAPATSTAYASTQTVMVDGQPVTFNAYALKDEKGNLTNYVKLRDVAQTLNGSAAQFEVGYDGTISITTNKAYTANGSEMVENFSGDQSYTVNTSPVKVNGQTSDLEAITLSDSTGGYTYFKLRDLGKALGFDVSWVDGKIVIDPNSPYSEAR